VLAVIGGTGFGEFAGLADVAGRELDTPFGPAYVETGRLAGADVLFLPRHGHPPRFPPHRINYRANIRALRDAGASHVVAVTAVGTVNESLAVPQLVIPDQVIDYTFGREATFFDDRIHHIDFTFPYDTPLRNRLLDIAHRVLPGVPVADRGVYGCTQGPRLETAQEIRRLRIDGCDIVGMTAMPEAALAREIGLPYAGVSVTVNAGAGIGGVAVAMADIAKAMAEGMNWVRELITALAAG